jgi:hypothetical protein
LWLAACLCLGAVAACSRAGHTPGTAPAVVTAPAAASPATPPAADRFTFSSDGEWHASPWVALHGQQWQFSAEPGLAPELARTLWLRIDDQTWPLDMPRTLAIDRPGRISFRTDREWQPALPGQAAVQARRLNSGGGMQP